MKLFDLEDMISRVQVRIAILLKCCGQLSSSSGYYKS